MGILGPPYCGIGATIRIGREMLRLPYAEFFKYLLQKQKVLRFFGIPYISACVWKCEQYVYEGITASQNQLSCQKMGNGFGQGLQLLNSNETTNLYSLTVQICSINN